ncbi:MAG: purine-nucleoside phosphorylase [Pedosphaera sp.]|nr:purine-nucleoside phosphorylase [Pedosphaera sp.]MST00107.1 purine-nucleoside phosphorylase [Pedosphaera sp.]
MKTSPKPAVQILRRATPLRPRLALVLGSGFNAVLDRVEIAACLPYSKLPGFPSTRVTGHDGRAILGKLAGVPVLILSGRAHYYEGHELARVTFPIRVLAEYGIESLLLTNAAGGINRKFHPGDFIRLTDHINFMGANPLRGPIVEGRSHFVDLTQVYDPALATFLQRAAKSAGAKLHAGVYLAVSGPSYETPAEIRAFARLGADAVGMSTVPEAIVARQCGLRVAGLSCITNAAAGQSPHALSHAEVLAMSRASGQRAMQLLENFATLYAKTETD